MIDTLTEAGTRHKGEGVTTTKIERMTAKIPSGTFLAAGIGSMALAAVLQLSGKKREANFVGLWVPTILILGLYNKLVKENES